MENNDKIKGIIEALLIVSENGLSREELRNAITDSSIKEIDEGISLLKEEYEKTNRAFNIAEIAGKCRIVTRPEYMPWIGNLYQKEADKLTGPSLETLAIIAYKQPATRAEVESVRGVNVGGVLKTLLDKELIKVRGRKDVIGRPLMYGTTEKFLELFGLNSLEDLPMLRDFGEEDLEYGKPQEEVETENEKGNQEEAAEEEVKVEVTNINENINSKEEKIESEQEIEPEKIETIIEEDNATKESDNEAEKSE